MTQTLERIDALETGFSRLEAVVAEARHDACHARIFTEDAWAIIPKIHYRLTALANGQQDLEMQFRELAQTQKEQAATLDQHTVTLGRHTAVLNQHTSTLNEHTRLLNAILDRLDGMAPRD
ncbi:hypothetical protein J5X84_16695 [Streptosporangiaceae bacterium NEAU-GS5]|nr:hypothetical protein [Streptosporangiaceae bacterium NEAU-GS5]